MQDKEFDQLFRDRFSEAEIEPSANLWNNIEAELAPKKKKGFPVFWMAAAVGIVAVTAGLLFTKTEKIGLQGPVQMAQHIAPEQVEAPVKTALENDYSSSEVEEEVESTPLVIAPSIDVNYKSEYASVKVEKPKKDLGAMQPIDENAHLPNTTLASTASVEKDGWVSDTRTVLASVNTESQTADDVINENDQADRKGIRNVGDLVNFVVDKVDKRENKFLKFNTDDDDNSSLIGINIGFIKLNSRKHK